MNRTIQFDQPAEPQSNYIEGILKLTSYLKVQNSELLYNFYRKNVYNCRKHKPDPSLVYFHK